MTTYARLNEVGTVEAIFDLTPEQYAAMQANGKAARLRLWIVDPQPNVTATQVAERGPITVNATEAHQTWTVREKTQAELDTEANAADRATIKALFAAIAADLAAYNANPDVSGTAVERIAKLEVRVKDLERQVRRLNLIDRYYLRSFA